MTASYGLTYTDVEQFTGIAYTDLKQSGATMTSNQWQTFCATYIEIIAQVVHRYCNVPTFDPAQAEAAIVELRSGRGTTDDWDYPTQYIAQDYQFYLQNLYFTGTIGVTPYAAIKVEEDIAGKSDVPSWTTRTVRSASAGGDYEVITKRENTMISFHNNVPAKGDNNVRFTYYTGYSPTSKEYSDIKYQILRVFKNLILSKKYIQQILTITATGTRDFTGMTNQYNEAQILSHMEESTLKRYRRVIAPGAGPFTD